MSTLRPTTASSSVKYHGQPVTVTARLTLSGEHVKIVEEWIGQELARTHGRVNDQRILFAGSRDGFSNQAFHENCDGFSPTLTFIQLHNGW